MKRIIIIHSSEIVRKGLATILRSFFAAELLQLEKIDDLHPYANMKNYSLIVILENADQTVGEPFQTLRKSNQIKLVNFTNSLSENLNPTHNSNYTIFLDSPALNVQEIISNCWKPAEKVNRPQENDELSLREKEVLRLVAMGHSNKIIADKLYISVHTVISHRKNISDKTGIKSISGLTVYAILNNLIDTSTLDLNDLI